MRGRSRGLLSEIAGGLGDSGLLIPIAMAMVALNGLNATAVFTGAGLVYCATALHFRVPVPVQPLKAFGAAAIALQLDAATIAAGAVLIALSMAALWASGLAEWLAERFPQVLVRGIQASVALLLCKAAIELARSGNWAGLPPIDPAIGLAIAVGACGILFASRAMRFPGTLVVLGAGAAVGLAVGGPPGELRAGPEPVSLSLPAGDDLAVALSSLVLAQLPLTFGNSIVATVDAERSYFGRRAERVRPGALAISIGLANGLAGLTQGLPVCHGAGGVTAHYKLGARTWRATFSVGVLLIVLGLALGGAVPALLALLAPPALAGMLLFVGIQHGLLAATLERPGERALAAAVGMITLVSGNLAIGFAVGAAALLARGAWRRVAGAPDGVAGASIAKAGGARLARQDG